MRCRLAKIPQDFQRRLFSFSFFDFLLEKIPEKHFEGMENLDGKLNFN